MNRPDAIPPRVVLIGDASVGKTSLFNYLIGHSFNAKELATVGANWHGYTTNIGGKTVTFQIWDTAGQEKYRSLTPIYFRGSRAAVVVFDVTNPTSFQAIDQWIAAFGEHAGEGARVVVVGNKCDAEERRVTEGEAQQWAEAKQIPLFHASAKTGNGVEEPFRFLAADFDGIIEAKEEVRRVEKSSVCGC